VVSLQALLHHSVIEYTYASTNITLTTRLRKGPAGGRHRAREVSGVWKSN
jgi:hypothetical protein